MAQGQNLKRVPPVPRRAHATEGAPAQAPAGRVRHVESASLAPAGMPCIGGALAQHPPPSHASATRRPLEEAGGAALAHQVRSALCKVGQAWPAQVRVACAVRTDASSNMPGAAARRLCGLRFAHTPQAVGQATSRRWTHAPVTRNHTFWVANRPEAPLRTCPSNPSTSILMT